MFRRTGYHSDHYLLDLKSFCCKHSVRDSKEKKGQNTDKIHEEIKNIKYKIENLI